MVSTATADRPHLQRDLKIKGPGVVAKMGEGGVNVKKLLQLVFQNCLLLNKGYAHGMHWE